MPKLSLSLYQQHVERWKGCTACDLSKVRNRVVLARGTVPCDVLFVGEAPGDSEDVVGRPFCGPAGILMDHILKRGVPAGIRVALTNLVCCLPKYDNLTGEPSRKNGVKGEPGDPEVEACSPRLKEFVEIAEPSLLVAVGNLARDWLDPDYRRGIKFGRKIPMVSIQHPAYIKRQNIAHQGLLVQKCVVQVRNAVLEHLEK